MSPVRYILTMEFEDIEHFYNTNGWQLIGGDTHDALINENLTLVASQYVSKVRNRITKKIGQGDTLLDVGCGPIQYPEYLDYSRNFALRICVDLSSNALSQARQKIGNHGEFIQGDYLKIPTPRQAPFAGATLINVLYHVEKNSQEFLVRKILGDLSPGSNLVVVYSNPHTFSAFMTRALVFLKRFFFKLFINSTNVNFENPIYFFRYPVSFWDQFKLWQ